MWTILHYSSDPKQKSTPVTEKCHSENVTLNSWARDVVQRYTCLGMCEVLCSIPNIATQTHTQKRNWHIHYLVKSMKAYCEQLSLPTKQIRFWFNRQPINEMKYILHSWKWRTKLQLRVAAAKMSCYFRNCLYPTRIHSQHSILSTPTPTWSCYILTISLFLSFFLMGVGGMMGTESRNWTTLSQHGQLLICFFYIK
jgi:hypothetical protein